MCDSSLLWTSWDVVGMIKYRHSNNLEFDKRLEPSAKLWSIKNSAISNDSDVRWENLKCKFDKQGERDFWKLVMEFFLSWTGKSSRKCGSFGSND